MKRLLMAGACAAAVLSLGACAGLQKIDLPATVNALAAAGCKGTIHDTVTATTASGISPGSASVTHDFNGSCDPANARPPAAGTVTTGAVISTSPNVSGPQ